MYVYVCMYRGRPSWRCPWDRAFQLGQGEGPIGLVGPISQPRGTIGTASLTCAFSKPTLLQVAKDVLYPHVGGTVTHRARHWMACVYSRAFKKSKVCHPYVSTRPVALPLYFSRFAVMRQQINSNMTEWLEKNWTGTYSYLQTCTWLSKYICYVHTG